MDEVKKEKARILVTGGAGHIGSHMAKVLDRAGMRVTVLDDLSTGHRNAMRYGKAIEGSIADRELLDDVFSRHQLAALVNDRPKAPAKTQDLSNGPLYDRFNSLLKLPR